MSDIKNLDLLLPKIGSGSTSKALGTAGSAGDSKSFSDILQAALAGVNNEQFNADTAMEAVLKGESTDIADTMIALKKADTSFKMMMEVRNKLLEAYQEVIKTPV